MAYSSKEIIDYLLANPSMSDAEIASAMQTYNVTPSQMAAAVGLPVEEVQTRYNEAAPSVYTAENVNKLADQILSQGTTEKWTGGLPPEKAALYMADELAKSGVTDIAQVAKGDDGIINSMTGEKLISGYGERTGGNLWSGSYEGKGNTGFGVNFDESGKPVFYTTGASSSDTKDIARIIQAGLLLSGAGGALGGALGLTGAAASGVGTGLISAGTAAIGGANLEDALKTGLLSGGLAYGGNELANALKYQDVPIDFKNMTADQINDALDVNFANDLSRTGMSDAQIKSFLANPASVYDATQAITTPTAVSTPVTDGGTVAVTAPTTPSLSNVLSTIASTTPTVNVAAPKAPQQVDQAVLDLVNSQLATNVATPANVQVTAQKPVTNQDIVNSIVASLPITTPTTTPVAQQTITAQKPATVQEVVNAITATLPTVTPTQAATIAEQVVTSNRPVTTQEVVNAITATLPAVVTPTVTSPTVAEQVVTAQKPITTQEVVNAITAALPTVPAVTTPVVPEQVVTDKKTSSITDDVTAATIPLIQPSTPLTPTQVTAEKELSNSEKIRLAQLGLTAAGLLGAGAAASSGSGGTQFPIVPIPESWGNPPKTGVAPFTPLTPINFGDRNLLIGTQWEKFLDPNYGKVPEPVQYSQPSNLSYNDLMGILGSKQGMPPASSLSINDIISGIQNQYGQASRSTMG